MAPKTLIDTGVDRAAGVERATGARLGRPWLRERSRPEHGTRVGAARVTPRAIANRLRVGLMAGSEKHVALAVATAGTLALAALSIVVGHEPTPRGDDLIYERMASDPLGQHTFPFAYRIAVPWLVHLSPLSHTLSFELLAWLSAGGAAGFAYLLMRRLGAARGLASALALMLALSPAMLVVGLRAGRNPDAATMLFLMAGTLFALERRTRALAATLALGVLVREAELFLIPLAYALWAERWWDSRAMRQALAVGAPALLICIALRAAIPTVGGAQVPGYGGPLLASRWSLLTTGIGDGLVEARRMLSVYGPLWIAAPLALGGMAFARRGLVLVAACLLAMTFALDWGRMIFLAAPVFFPAGAFTLTRHPRWRIPALAAFAVLVAAYAIHMRSGGLRVGITEAPPPPYPVR